MDKNIIVFNVNDKELLEYINLFCEKMLTNFIISKTLMQVEQMINILKTKYVIIDPQNIDIDELLSYTQSHLSTNFVFINYILDGVYTNIYSVEKEDFCKQFVQIYKQLQMLNDSKKDEKNISICEEISHLGLSNKHIGGLYLKDTIFEIFKDRSKLQSCNRFVYPLIAQKYGVNLINIERTIRFCISKAFNNGKNEMLSYISSKQNKAPTIKETIIYILSKIV